jgi:hypothetical protein
MEVFRILNSTNSTYNCQIEDLQAHCKRTAAQAMTWLGRPNPKP